MPLFNLNKCKIMRVIMMGLLLTLCVSMVTDKIKIDPKSSDILMYEDLQGHWEHDRTVYDGNTLFYYRELDFFADSTLTCDRMWENDTVLIHGFWFIEDSLLYLYTYYEKEYLLTGLGKINYLNNDSLALSSTETDKVSYYLKD